VFENKQKEPKFGHLRSQELLFEAEVVAIIIVVDKHKGVFLSRNNGSLLRV